MAEIKSQNVPNSFSLSLSRADAKQLAGLFPPRQNQVGITSKMKRILDSSLYYHFLMRSFEPPSLFQTYSPAHFTSICSHPCCLKKMLHPLWPLQILPLTSATCLLVLSHLSLEVSESIWALRNSTFFFTLNPFSSCHDRFSSAPLQNLRSADSEGTME